MISTDSVQTLIGRNAVSPDGDKIGTIGQVYLDNDNGQPEWATIKTGLFGTRESFVPLADAELTDDSVRLPYDKNRIKGAPGIEADRDLSPEEEDSLYQYYGTSTTGTRTSAGYEADRDIADRDFADRDFADRDFADRDFADREAADADRARTGYDTSGPTTDEAMTRSEERVRAGVERREAGRARLRKYVVTEQQQVQVPVAHEEVRLEREPITDANRDQAMAGPDLSEEEHEVVLTEERPVVQKETVPVERVRLAKDQVQQDETVNVDVRQERIETDVDGTDVYDERDQRP